MADGRVQLVVNDDGSLGYKLDGADTVYPFKGAPIVISGTIYGTNNSQGGNVSGEGYASFKLPKNTKVEFTVVKGSWSFKANKNAISTGFVTTADETTIEMHGTVSNGARPTPMATYILTFNYSD